MINEKTEKNYFRAIISIMCSIAMIIALVPSLVFATSANADESNKIYVHIDAPKYYKVILKTNADVELSALFNGGLDGKASSTYEVDANTTYKVYVSTDGYGTSVLSFGTITPANSTCYYYGGTATNTDTADQYTNATTMVSSDSSKVRVHLDRTDNSVDLVVNDESGNKISAVANSKNVFEVTPGLLYKVIGNSAAKYGTFTAPTIPARFYMKSLLSARPAQTAIGMPLLGSSQVATTGVMIFESYKSTDLTDKTEDVSIYKQNGYPAGASEKTLTAAAIPDYSASQEIDWTVESGATCITTPIISGNNITITPQQPGTVVLKATAKGTSKSAKYTMNIKAQIANSLTLNLAKLNLKKNATYQLKATIGQAWDNSLTWQSSNTRVATVDENGLITAKATGDATITVTNSASGLKATCKVVASKQNADGKVASIGDVQYDSLDAAISAAKEDDTIKLLDNLSLESNVNIPNGVTLDLNGFEISEFNTQLIIPAGSTASIINGKISQLNTNGILVVNGTLDKLSNCILDAGNSTMVGRVNGINATNGGTSIINEISNCTFTNLQYGINSWGCYVKLMKDTTFDNMSVAAVYAGSSGRGVSNFEKIVNVTTLNTPISFDVRGGANVDNVYCYSHITINSGTFDGKMSVQQGVLYPSSAYIEINGGRFASFDTSGGTEKALVFKDGCSLSTETDDDGYYYVVYPEAVQTAIDAIDKLPAAEDVSTADEANITAADTAYNALSDDQKTLILNSEDIADCQAALVDAKAIEPVLAELEALNEDSASFIADAEKLAADYNALTDEQKAKISDQNTLRIDVAKKSAAVKKANDAELAKAQAELDAAKAALAKLVSKVTVNVATVNAKAITSAITKAGATSANVKTIVLGKKVKKISKGAFKSFKNVKTVFVKSKKLTKKSIKNSLKSSKVKTIKVNVSSSKSTNKKYAAKYMKLFKKANSGKKVIVKYYELAK
jgi:hypothetical protein